MKKNAIYMIIVIITMLSVSNDILAGEQFDMPWGNENVEIDHDYIIEDPCCYMEDFEQMLPEEDVNGDSDDYDLEVYAEPEDYDVVYNFDDSWYLTADGGIIIEHSPSFCIYYKPKNWNCLDWINEKLGVSSFELAKSEDIEYVVNFLLPIDNCRCVYYMIHERELSNVNTSQMKDGDVWVCPLCNKEFVLHELGETAYKKIMVDDQLISVGDHICSCALKDEDKYWTCDKCGERIELSKARTFGGYFRREDKYGLDSIEKHEEICNSCIDKKWTCKYCGKTFDRYFGMYFPFKEDYTLDFIIIGGLKDDGKYEFDATCNHENDDRSELADKAAEKIVEEYISDDMNELEKAYYLFQWIKNNVTYAYRSAGYGKYYCEEENYNELPEMGTDEFKELFFVKNGKVYKYYEYTEKELALLKEYGCIFTGQAFGCLIQKDCVCGGNAKGFAMLLSKVGIEAHVRSGNFANVGHAWNVIKINGEYYNIDPTSNTFFLLDDGSMNPGSYSKPYFDNGELERQIYECTDSSFYKTDIKEIYQMIYGTQMQERSLFDGKSDEGRTEDTQEEAFYNKEVRVDTVISSDTATLIVGDVSGIAIPGYRVSDIIMKGKAGRYDRYNGIFTANYKGKVKLFVKQGNKKKVICKIRIEKPRAKSVVRLKCGKKKNVKLKGTMQSVVYEISENKIARVSSDGTVIGIKPGKTELTAQVGTHSYRTTILVQ